MDIADRPEAAIVPERDRHVRDLRHRPVLEAAAQGGRAGGGSGNGDRFPAELPAFFRKMAAVVRQMINLHLTMADHRQIVLRMGVHARRIPDQDAVRRRSISYVG